MIKKPGADGKSTVTTVTSPATLTVELPWLLQKFCSSARRSMASSAPATNMAVPCLLLLMLLYFQSGGGRGSPATDELRHISSCAAATATSLCRYRRPPGAADRCLGPTWPSSAVAFLCAWCHATRRRMWTHGESSRAPVARPAMTNPAHARAAEAATCSGGTLSAKVGEGRRSSGAATSYARGCSLCGRGWSVALCPHTQPHRYGLMTSTCSSRERQR